MPPSRRRRDPLRRFERRLVRPFVPGAEAVLPLAGEGADTITYLASSAEVANTTGAFLVNRKVTEPSAAARDNAAAKRLWAESEKLASFHRTERLRIARQPSRASPKHGNLSGERVSTEGEGG